LAILIFILGLVIGSFLNVCIFRIPKNKNIVSGTSHCPHCHTGLEPLDLIPVLSFLLLRGKCRYCNELIRLRYPLVELLTGFVFLIAFLTVDFRFLLIKYLIILSLLIVITMIDLELQLIPDSLVISLLGWSILWQIFLPEQTWWQAVLGAVIGGGLLLAIAILSKGGMGGGDIKLMFAAGFSLGQLGTLLALFIAFVTGGLVGAVLLATGRKTKKTPIPFGPFLALGITLSSLWGHQIIGFYLNFLK